MADMFDTETFFAEVLLPLPIAKLFTYRIPSNLEARVGQRVIVPFGQRKIETGIIRHIHRQSAEYEVKYILDIMGEEPIVTPQQFELIEWMAAYYMCTAGEALRAALPTGLKISSESSAQIHPEFDFESRIREFSQSEWRLLEQLAKSPMKYSEIAAFFGKQSIAKILKSLASKNAIILYEEIHESYKPKRASFLRLTPPYEKKEALEKLFKDLSAKAKQEDVLLKYIQHIPVLSQPELNKTGVSKKEFLKVGISESSLQTLIKNNVFETFEVIVPRYADYETEVQPASVLSEKQALARDEILSQFSQYAAAALYGVTGSGKTEIYIDLIKRSLEGGSQVLYLLPEIALSIQIVARLKKIFGNAMGVYHSRFSDNERVETYRGVLSGQFKVVAGVRSSVFLPFDNLGLIIVDEEHEPSYKQQDPAPRYQARDSALMLGRIHHAKVLLGSATPSLETYFNAREKKMGWVELTDRFGNANLPSIEMVDLKEERQRKTIKGEFSMKLLEGLRKTIEEGGQAILFQNRRGYSPMVRCEQCNWIPKCVNCSVSLTYHQFSKTLLCHYCGYRQNLPNACPECTSTHIRTMGYGTEKIEEELNLYLENATTERMDFDTTRSKTGYESIIKNFESGKTQILVGTQMVAKGLDFDKVQLAGIFNADRLMHFPDFRSYERALQLMLQVSGRAGRRNAPGKVLIQTSSPEHALFQYLLKNDVVGFLETELSDRHQHHFPPYTRLIEITVKHRDKRSCLAAAEELASQVKKSAQVIVAGPGEPMISKIRNEFLFTFLLKIHREQTPLQPLKLLLQNIVSAFLNKADHRNIRVKIDVDPM